MPVVPFAAAVGSVLGTSAAVGGTVVAAGTIAAGLGIANTISSAQQASAAKKAMAASQNVQPNASQTVGDGSTANPSQLGRAALISTSPSGVLGTDPTGRRKLLGN